MALLVAALLLGVTVAVRAQAGTGAITGVVRDPSGGVIPGATVTVASGELRRTAVTNANGTFRIAPVPPGTYRIEATLAGFRRTTVESMVVSAGSDTVADLSLRIGILAIVDCVAPAGGIGAALGSADAAVHLRVISPLRSALLGQTGSVIGTEHSALILDVVKGSDRGLKSQDTLRFWQHLAGEWFEDGKRHVGQHRPYRSGDELVALLTWDAREGWADRHCGHLSLNVVAGAVAWKAFLGPAPGIRADMPVSEFLAALRKLLLSRGPN